MEKKTLAIVLAAGFSRRMQKNKLLLKFHDKTFLEIILEKITSFSFGGVILVVSERDILNKNFISKFAIYSLFNAYSEKGISESIKIAISSYEEILKEKANCIEQYMFFVVDQPLLKRETISILLEKSDGEKIVVPRNKHERGSPVIFPKKYKKDLLSLQGDRGGRQILEREKENIFWVEIAKEELKDIDTWEEYEKLLEKIR